MEKTPDILYHYTSLAALFSMLGGTSQSNDKKTMTLRATHAAYLNDMTEGLLLPEILKKLGVRKDTLSIISSIQVYPFVFSLSILKDDLNMWRCYGDEGKGVCIGFKSSIFEDFDKTKKIQLQKCIYDETTIRKDIKEQNILKSSLTENGDRDITELSRFLFNNCLTYKHHSFQAEDEWRCIIHDLPTTFDLKGDTIKPYYEMKIPVDAIESIKFGPICSKYQYDRNCFSLKRMMGTLSNQIKINLSKLPLN